MFSLVISWVTHYPFDPYHFWSVWILLIRNSWSCKCVSPKPLSSVTKPHSSLSSSISGPFLITDFSQYFSVFISLPCCRFLLNKIFSSFSKLFQFQPSFPLIFKSVLHTLSDCYTVFYIPVTPHFTSLTPPTIKPSFFLPNVCYVCFPWERLSWVELIYIINISSVYHSHRIVHTP